MARAVARPAAVALISAALSVAALETVYRLAAFDPYRGELREYNPPNELSADESRPTLLFMGDSLTAGRGSYPDLVRQARPDLRMVNGGIPGSFVLQANLVARQRFRRFKPSILVYQLNVGNDLLNVRYPVSWQELPATRNVYWTLAHRLRFLEYTNYKLGQLARARRAARHGTTTASVTDTVSCRYSFDDFEPDRYTRRERLYLRAEPDLYENQAFVRPARRRDYEKLMDGLHELLSHCNQPDCQALVLVVPHATQVHADYQQAMRRLGARFSEPQRLLADNSPFVAGLRDFVSGKGRSDVRIVDAQPALREAERSGRRGYYLHDPHLNVCGQQALATLVLSRLPDPSPL